MNEQRYLVNTLTNVNNRKTFKWDVWQMYHWRIINSYLFFSLWFHQIWIEPFQNKTFLRKCRKGDENHRSYENWSDFVKIPVVHQAIIFLSGSFKLVICCSYKGMLEWWCVWWWHGVCSVDTGDRENQELKIHHIDNKWIVYRVFGSAFKQRNSIVLFWNFFSSVCRVIIFPNG